MDFVQAYALADRGFSVMPISRKKIPLVKWLPLQKRRASADKLADWWHRFRNPDAGIVTGRVSGIVVVDCDDAAAVEYVRALGIPETYTVKTARGLHFYFKYPKGTVIRNSSGRIGVGVDVRGEGGFVVAAGSKHKSGFVYRVECDAGIADCPEWLVAEGV